MTFSPDFSGLSLDTILGEEARKNTSDAVCLLGIFTVAQIPNSLDCSDGSLTS